MEFDPQPIKLKVANFFENKNELFLGKITTFSDDDFVKFTNKWVTEIDICLSKVIKYSPIYIELFTHRGFTYNEYLELFLNIDEGLYICFAAYEYFTILKKEQLFSIRSSLEASIAGYLKCIHKEFEKGCLNTLHSVYKSFSANITPKELQVHAYISGKTGSGKSE